MTLDRARKLFDDAVRAEQADAEAETAKKAESLEAEWEAEADEERARELAQERWEAELEAEDFLLSSETQVACDIV